jgi:hypothetical protein
MSQAAFKLLHACHIVALLGVGALGAWGLATTVVALGSEATHHGLPRAAAALAALAFAAAFLPSIRPARFAGFVLPVFVAVTVVSVVSVQFFVSGLVKGFPPSAAPITANVVAYSALVAVVLVSLASARHFWKSSSGAQA